MAVDRAQQRVDVQNIRSSAPASSGWRRKRHQMRPGYRGELFTVPEGELAQEDPQRRRRIHLIEHRGVPPARSTFAYRCCPRRIHSGDDRGQLAGRVDRTDFSRVEGSCTCSPIRRERPVCSASSSTGTDPAADTKFCSSSIAESAVNVYDECIESAFSDRGQMRRQHSYYPRPEGIFAVHTPIKSPAHPRIQAKGRTDRPLPVSHAARDPQVKDTVLLRDCAERTTRRNLVVTVTKLRHMAPRTVEHRAESDNGQM